MARVSVVIVTFNSGAEIGSCLDALNGVPDIEVVVVDNASIDSTCEQVRQRGVRLIANDRNRGFAAAVNQGVRANPAPLLLLLNPDVRLEGGLETLIAAFADEATGAAGGMLLGEDGRPQTGFMARNLPTPAALVFEILGVNRAWPQNPVNWHYRCFNTGIVTPCVVEQPAGAFLMFSRTAFARTGGFDERFYPVWFEDVDFCARLKGAGYRVLFVPAAVAKHTGGHSVGALSLENRERYWYGSLLEYAAKYYNPLAFRMVCFAVFLGVIIRAARVCVRTGSLRTALSVYGAVGRLALARLFGLRRDALKAV